MKLRRFIWLVLSTKHIPKLAERLKFRLVSADMGSEGGLGGPLMSGHLPNCEDFRILRLGVLVKLMKTVRPELSNMFDPDADSEIVLGQFNRLMQELLRGVMNRNCFRPWEIELLLDIESCELSNGGRKDTLKRYQKAVQKQLDRGATRPMKLSEYLKANRARRLAQEEERSLAAAAAD
jgi:hypothetical protein